MSIENSIHQIILRVGGLNDPREVEQDTPIRELADDIQEDTHFLINEINARDELFKEIQTLMKQMATFKPEYPEDPGYEAGVQWGLTNAYFQFEAVLRKYQAVVD